MEHQRHYQNRSGAHAQNANFSQLGIPPELATSSEQPSRQESSIAMQRDQSSHMPAVSLEEHMRLMILSNQQHERPIVPIPQYSSYSSELRSAQEQTVRSPRPNQRERRQQARHHQETLHDFDSNRAEAHDRVEDPNRSVNAKFHSPRETATFSRDNYRGRGAGGPIIPQYQRVSYRQRSNYEGQPPRNGRSLYDPRTNQRNGPRHDDRSGMIIQRQIDFCTEHVIREVRQAEITPEEYQSKDNLRKTLENMCKKAVIESELANLGQCDAKNVQLQCFGSLASTFATTGSDMDLIFLSPDSVIDPAQPESPLPRVIEKALLDQGYGARLLTRTRVPIIKFCESPSHELLGRLRDARTQWEMEGDTNQEQDKELKKPRSDLTGHDDMESSEIQAAKVQPPSSHMDSSLQGTDDGGAKSADREGHHATTSIERGNEITRPPIPTEAEDPSLEAKSDIERVRLYRLAMKEEWYEPEERKIIMNFINKVEDASSDHLIYEARSALGKLPNVLRRYREPPPKILDFPKDGVGTHCDINFSNPLALHNSKLLRCYSLCDSRVRPFVLFVKAWTKRRRINSPYSSTLSSYGYVLMALHYLMNIVYPRILPNLQHFPPLQQDAESMSIRTVAGYDVLFYRNEAQLRLLAEQGRLTSNQETLGSLIRGFFAYYGSDGYNNFHWMRDTLSLRTIGGIIPKERKGWTAAKTETIEGGQGSKDARDVRQRYLIAIEDPFEIHHNVGRTVSHDGIVAIRDEFRRAHRLILASGTTDPRQGQMEDLMAESEDRGNLLFRHFGPRPRKRPATKPGELGAKAKQNS